MSAWKAGIRRNCQTDKYKKYFLIRKGAWVSN